VVVVAAGTDTAAVTGLVKVGFEVAEGETEAEGDW